jgi:hypothetical protein
MSLKGSVSTQEARASAITLEEVYARVIAAVYGVSARGKEHD